MATPRRSSADWALLIKEQAQSNLTAAAFCRERGISPKYFSHRKQKHFASLSPFAQAVTVIPARPSLATICLQQGDCRIELPTSTTPQWLATLLRELC